MQIGMQAYFTAINAQGGVNGRTIKLLTRDDGYEPEKAAAAVKALIREDKVFALAALPIRTEEQVPLVGLFTGAQALREPFNRQVFHVRALTKRQLKQVGTGTVERNSVDVGAGVVISQVVPFPYAPNSPIVREYQQRMLDAGRKDFDFSSLEGYLTARVLVEGLRRAGRDLTRETLISGLESMHSVNLGGFTINYSAKDHQGSSFTDLTIIGRGGKFVH